MTDQGEFNLLEGEKLRDEGCDLVLTHNGEYKERFYAVGLRILNETGAVTSEAVIREIGMPPGHPSAVGAAMRALAVAEGLTKTAFVKATRPTCHAAVIAQWRRLDSSPAVSGK